MNSSGYKMEIIPINFPPTTLNMKLPLVISPTKINTPLEILKPTAVYEKMLQEDKIVEMYKCMSKDCFYTTDIEQNFTQHLQIHKDESLKNNDKSTDFYKCAYCYVDFQNCDDLMTHLKKVHTYCQHICKYCFYRSVSLTYVELHQVKIIKLIL